MSDEQRAGQDAAVKAWFGARLPQEWNEPPAEVTTDREEILVRLTIGAPAGSEREAEKGDDAGAAARAEAIAGHIARFREETRDRRIQVAREAEHRFGRKVAWAVTAGGETEIFTSLAVPVMTRLRQPERLVLDTLVDAGVARSRAHALAWCVRLVGDNTSTWLADLRSAMAEVEKVRKAGPGADQL
ncbi:hypothetical protein LWF15_05825 [Kineosporia rhizophila]|uniref:hypothetical protein n=1 Tax=Kineosporia TaxID=49184 RepID=UPI001E393D75|nr:MULTISPECIES: hypothetical protein [Kineosporia]MCE0535022.1 hypothetical protein [Kineosporia rhizophila]GLY14694.1 hypothetical protein Kisp01_17090 [Kineosporia sp. NBRC 101677]